MTKFAAMFLFCVAIQGNLGDVTQRVPFALQPYIRPNASDVHLELIDQFSPLISKLKAEIIVQEQIAKLKINSTTKLLLNRINNSVQELEEDILILKDTISHQLKKPNATKFETVKTCILIQQLIANTVNAEQLDECIPKLVKNLEVYRLDIVKLKSSVITLATACQKLNPWESQSGSMTKCLETNLNDTRTNLNYKVTQINRLINDLNIKTNDCIEVEKEGTDKLISQILNNVVSC